MVLLFEKLSELKELKTSENNSAFCTQHSALKEDSALCTLHSALNSASSTLPALLSTTCFGPVQWYQKLHRHPSCLMEAHEHFIKQTYRNRYIICSPQGPLALTIPVEHGGSDDIRSIRISDHGSWRRMHRNALQTCYGDSPFFDYYADDILPFFEKHWDFLYDFNMEATEMICNLLDVGHTITETAYYIPAESLKTTDGIKTVCDFRDAIRPKHPLPDPDFTPRPYYQLPHAGEPFLPNLSILDLLCNMGPEGIFWL